MGEQFPQTIDTHSMLNSGSRVDFTSRVVQSHDMPIRQKDWRTTESTVGHHGVLHVLQFGLGSVPPVEEVAHSADDSVAKGADGPFTHRRPTGVVSGIAQHSHRLSEKIVEF